MAAANGYEVYILYIHYIPILYALFRSSRSSRMIYIMPNVKYGTRCIECVRKYVSWCWPGMSIFCCCCCWLLIKTFSNQMRNYYIAPNATHTLLCFLCVNWALHVAVTISYLKIREKFPNNNLLVCVQIARPGIERMTNKFLIFIKCLNNHIVLFFFFGLAVLNNFWVHVTIA